MKKMILNHSNILGLIGDLAARICEVIDAAGDFDSVGARPIKIYGIPRGGVPVAYLLEGYSRGDFKVVDSPTQADAFVDDIVDSGATRQKYFVNNEKQPFFALIDKTAPTGSKFKESWIVFPWEGSEEKSIDDNIVRLLQYIGDDPLRQGLIETPKRVAKAWAHWGSGYGADIPKILKTFEDGADGCDEMVVVKDIPFYSHCEHHLAPFFGTATVAYIPDGRIVGLSKIPRIVEAFSRRLQVQERLTNQIADALQGNLYPKGVGVIVQARHLCMESRGIQKQGSTTVTSALRGVMKDDARARAEFLALSTGCKSI